MTDDDIRPLLLDSEWALDQWLDEHPVLAQDGKPMVWSNGRPVALDVLEALDALARVKDVLAR